METGEVSDKLSKGLGSRHKYKYWTREEEEFLRQNYLTTSDVVLAKELSRTRLSIRARRMYLGLKRSNTLQEPWDSEEEKILLANYGTLGGEVVAEKLGRPLGSVRTKYWRIKNKATNAPVDLRRAALNTASLSTTGKKEFERRAAVFMSWLITCYDAAKKSGVERPDIGAFLTAYREEKFVDIY